jgi:DNA-binding MarR family transcriptional regulator
MLTIGPLRHEGCFGGDRRKLVHPLFFGLKRAHQATLRISRDLLVASDLTPARLDMMFAIAEEARGILQSALSKALGVTRATVSRMLRSLEQLGFVRRQRVPRDQRQWRVLLTARGLDAFGFAEQSTTPFAGVYLEHALTSRAPFSSSYDEMKALEAFLHCIRVAFWDTGSVSFPWFSRRLVPDG